MRNYFYYRRLGFSVSRSFELAFGHRLGEVMLNLAGYIVTVAIMVWLLTASANALVVEYDARHAERNQYVSNLEQTLATCTSRGDNPIMIGGELWMCGAAPTGVKK